MRRWLLLLVFTVTAGGLSAAEFPIDLNSAPLADIMELPLSAEDAQAVYEYREFRSYFGSVYDLMKVPGIDAGKLEILKPLVRIEPVDIDYFAERMNVAQRNVRSWGSSEGSNEGLIDLWIDIAKDPPNINTAGVYDLMNLQNVSPVDAVAIFKHRTAIGTYRSRRDLRYTPGLSGWGYMNARSLVEYQSTEQKGELHGRYQVRARSTEFHSDVVELLQEDVYSAQNVYDSWYDRLGLYASRPEVSQKLYLKYYLTGDVTLRGGMLGWRQSGEESLGEHMKGFAGVEGLKLGPVLIDKVYVGDYLVGFGQGLVMENSDYFKPRKSGYSWDKRYYGVLGDISRSEEYKLSGVAVQATWRDFKGIGFYSDDEKDVVLNEDGSAAAYISLNPAIKNETLVQYGLPPMRDALHERTYGGNLRYLLRPGSHVGVTGYESRYNRRFDPMGGETIIDRPDRIIQADNEFLRSYRSPGKFRRVFGVEMQSVFNNYCVQAEYAEMDVNGNMLKVGDDPAAFVSSLWAQYNNLSFLVLYRDYDLGFDNPYCRGFSNYARFKGTILEDHYYLTDPLYGLIFDNGVAPQAERGVYLSTRYRLTTSIIPRIEYDRWTRVSDGATYSRFVGNLEVRLLYPLRFKIRQQYQGRNRADELTATSYSLADTRLELEMRLSNYDMIEFTYLKGGTEWPPRPRLVGGVEPDGDHPASGQAFQPSWALLLHAIHNFTDKFNVSVGALSYNGFLWFFEESDFVASDKRNSMRFWVSVQDRLSDNLWIELKAAYDRGLPVTNTDVRRYNQYYGGEIDAENIMNKEKYFRIQIDYMW
ncbi:MAG: helix-hairpin-helix domain-containing protein [Candidatus Eisenbacteria bacterium]